MFIKQWLLSQINKSQRPDYSLLNRIENSRRVIHTDFQMRCFLFSPLFSRVLLSSAQCVMARVKKINVVIYDDLAPWKLFSDKFSPYPNSSMRRSLVIFLLGTDHRHYHQYTDNGSLHRVRNNVVTFILKEHFFFSFLTASLSSSDSRNNFRLFMYLVMNSCRTRTLVWGDCFHISSWNRS